ncbi:MAG: ABC transporter ATP-binding protein [Chloroflexi bacterium]|nr:ABC transporter ATP-binding protein [Chloroflexota bacterium]MDA1174919.1 ABC transporter ATP-binding protein [Chloroflexota bacterium]
MVESQTMTAGNSSVSSRGTGARVQISNLVKMFGPVAAVDHINIDIEPGEFFTLLGPSGCGKTTTLRMVGGLEKPTEGSITIGDDVVVSVSDRKFVQPEKRDLGMVFQSYALWPHMTVFENVAYPLKMRKVKKSEISDRVSEALRQVGLAGFGQRPSPLLSGGQQQRVALARALVYSPRVLLLDEPLSNLDAKLRVTMRQELRELQERVDVTMIYVTHDQVEALSLSDRIAIMNSGNVEQIGTPQEVYLNPATAFAQDFLGQTIGVLGTMEDDGVVSVKGDSESRLKGTVADASLRKGDAVLVAIRPERMLAHSQMPTGVANVVRAKVMEATFVGDHYEYKAEIGDEIRMISLPSTTVYGEGDNLFLEFPESAVVVWGAAAQAVIANIRAD